MFSPVIKNNNCLREIIWKCSDFSKSFVPHRQKGSIVSLKLCRNLCSPRRSRVNNFNPHMWSLSSTSGVMV